MSDLQSAIQQVLNEIGIVGSFKLQTANGGDIHQAFTIETDTDKFFLKVNSSNHGQILASEFESLKKIAERFPDCYPAALVFQQYGDYALLLMQWLGLSPHNSHSARQLGILLAEQHKTTHDQYGWFSDNFIGSTPQLNEWMNNWGEFFKTERLIPQLELAELNGADNSLLALGEKLIAKLDDQLLPAEYQPEISLLHGDLWSGNTARLATGGAVLYDPAPYFGDRETDLAMTELFGRFPAEFYQAYQENYPLESTYQQRKALYQLYHILNHFNLFGSGYQNQAVRLIEYCLAS